MDLVGFFAELRHGMPEGGSIRNALATPLNARDRVVVAQYLRSASVLVATSQRAGDALDISLADVSGISIRTDGLAMWPEDLAYYVETYGVAVPDDLVARARLGAPTALSVEELMEIASMVWEAGSTSHGTSSAASGE